MQESIKKNSLTLIGDLARTSPEALDFQTLVPAVASALVTNATSPAVVNAAVKALGRIRSVDSDFGKRIRGLDVDRQRAIASHADAIKQYTLNNSSSKGAGESKSSGSSEAASTGADGVASGGSDSRRHANSALSPAMHSGDSVHGNGDGSRAGSGYGVRSDTSGSTGAGVHDGSGSAPGARNRIGGVTTSPVRTPGYGSPGPSGGRDRDRLTSSSERQLNVAQWQRPPSPLEATARELQQQQQASGASSKHAGGSARGSNSSSSPVAGLASVIPQPVLARLFTAMESVAPSAAGSLISSSSSAAGDRPQRHATSSGPGAVHSPGLQSPTSPGSVMDFSLLSPNGPSSPTSISAESAAAIGERASAAEGVLAKLLSMRDGDALWAAGGSRPASAVRQLLILGSNLILDPAFRVAIVGLNIIERVLILLGPLDRRSGARRRGPDRHDLDQRNDDGQDDAASLLGTFLPAIIERLADSKAAARHAAVKTMGAVIMSNGFNSVSGMIFPALHSRNKNAKESAIRVMIQALVQSKRERSSSSLDVASMALQCASLLGDSNVKIGASALELFSCINTYLSGRHAGASGPGEIVPAMVDLLLASGLSQSSPQWTSLVNRIQLMPTAVPKINNAGYLELPNESAGAFAANALLTAASPPGPGRDAGTSRDLTSPPLISADGAAAASNVQKQIAQQRSNGPHVGMRQSGPVSTANGPKIGSSASHPSSASSSAAAAGGGSSTSVHSHSHGYDDLDASVFMKQTMRPAGRDAPPTPLSVESMSAQNTPVKGKNERGGALTPASTRSANPPSSSSSQFGDNMPSSGGRERAFDGGDSADLADGQMGFMGRLAKALNDSVVTSGAANDGATSSPSFHASTGSGGVKAGGGAANSNSMGRMPPKASGQGLLADSPYLTPLVHQSKKSGSGGGSSNRSRDAGGSASGNRGGKHGGNDSAGGDFGDGTGAFASTTSLSGTANSTSTQQLQSPAQQPAAGARSSGGGKAKVRQSGSIERHTPESGSRAKQPSARGADDHTPTPDTSASPSKQRSMLPHQPRAGTNESPQQRATQQQQQQFNNMRNSVSGARDSNISASVVKDGGYHNESKMSSARSPYNPSSVHSGGNGATASWPSPQQRQSMPSSTQPATSPVTTGGYADNDGHGSTDDGGGFGEVSSPQPAAGGYAARHLASQREQAAKSPMRSPPRAAAASTTSAARGSYSDSVATRSRSRLREADTSSYGDDDGSGSVVDGVSAAHNREPVLQQLQRRPVDQRTRSLSGAIRARNAPSLDLNSSNHTSIGDELSPATSSVTPAAAFGFDGNDAASGANNDDGESPEPGEPTKSTAMRSALDLLKRRSRQASRTRRSTSANATSQGNEGAGVTSASIVNTVGMSSVDSPRIDTDHRYGPQSERGGLISGGYRDRFDDEGGAGGNSSANPKFSIGNWTGVGTSSSSAMEPNAYQGGADQQHPADAGARAVAELRSRSRSRSRHSRLRPAVSANPAIGAVALRPGDSPIAASADHGNNGGSPGKLSGFGNEESVGFKPNALNQGPRSSPDLGYDQRSDGRSGAPQLGGQNAAYSKHQPPQQQNDASAERLLGQGVDPSSPPLPLQGVRDRSNTNLKLYPSRFGSYDSAALNEEFGWDPYASHPPSPTKDSHRQYLKNGSAFSAASSGHSSVGGGSSAGQYHSYGASEVRGRQPIDSAQTVFSSGSATASDPARTAGWSAGISISGASSHGPEIINDREFSPSDPYSQNTPVSTHPSQQHRYGAASGGIMRSRASNGSGGPVRALSRVRAVTEPLELGHYVNQYSLEVQSPPVGGSGAGTGSGVYSGGRSYEGSSPTAGTHGSLLPPLSGQPLSTPQSGDGGHSGFQRRFRGASAGTTASHGYSITPTADGRSGHSAQDPQYPFPFALDTQAINGNGNSAAANGKGVSMTDMVSPSATAFNGHGGSGAMPGAGSSISLPGLGPSIKNRTGAQRSAGGSSSGFPSQRSSDFGSEVHNLSNDPSGSISGHSTPAADANGFDFVTTPGAGNGGARGGEERPIRPMANAEAFYRTLAAQAGGEGGGAALLSPSPDDKQIPRVPSGNTRGGSGASRPRAGTNLSPIRSRPTLHPLPSGSSSGSSGGQEMLLSAQHDGRDAGAGAGYAGQASSSASGMGIAGVATNSNSNSNYNGDQHFNSNIDDGQSTGTYPDHFTNASDAASVITTASASALSSSAPRTAMSRLRSRRVTSGGATQQGGGGAAAADVSISGQGYPASADSSFASQGSAALNTSAMTSGTAAGGGGHGVPSGVPTAEKLYVPSSQLSRLRNADAAVKTAVGDLANDNWERQFEACNLLRRLALFHPDALSSSLHATVVGLMPLCDSLRSSVAKIALMTFADLFAGMDRGMDGELESLMPSLIRRAADTNDFILQAAEEALTSMICNCGESRSLNALLTTAHHKNPNIRLKCALWLDRCVDKMGPRICGSKDLDRLVVQASKYMQEGSPEARHAGTRTLQRLLRIGAIDDRFLSRTIPDRQLSRIKDSIAKGVPEDVQGLGPSGLAVGSGGNVAGSGYNYGSVDNSFSSVASGKAPGSGFDGRTGSPARIVPSSNLRAGTAMSSVRGHSVSNHGSPARAGYGYATSSLNANASANSSFAGSIDDQGSIAAGGGTASLQGTPSRSATAAVRSRRGVVPGQRSLSTAAGARAAAQRQQQEQGSDAGGSSSTFTSSNMQDGPSPYAASNSTTSQAAGGGGAAAVRANRRQGSGLTSEGSQSDVLAAASSSNSINADALSAAVNRLRSGDWTERVAGLSELQDLTRRVESRSINAQQAVVIADELSQRLSDGHNKVTLAAVQCADSIVPLLRGEAIDRSAPVLLPQLAACLLSQQRPVAAGASSTMDRLLSSADAGGLLMPLVSLVRNGNTKLKASMLEKLASVIPAAHARRPQAVMRSVLPAVFELLDDGKPDVKTGTVDVLCRVADCVGVDSVLEVAKQSTLSDGQIDKLKRILRGK